METEISDKIEEAVNTISGIDELRSTSSEGVSTVVISFLLEKDGDVAAQEVRDRVNRVLPTLPRTIKQPTVEKFDPDSAPVMTLAVSADKPIRDITEYADKTLRRQLESVSGVGQVVVVGGRQRQINITLDPGAAAGAEPHGDRRVARARSAERRDPGRPRRGRFPGDHAPHPRPRPVGPGVRRHRRRRARGAPDPAARRRRRSKTAWPTRSTRANVSGKPTVLLAIRRQSGVNTVQMVDAVRERLDATSRR